MIACNTSRILAQEFAMSTRNEILEIRPVPTCSSQRRHGGDDLPEARPDLERGVGVIQLVRVVEFFQPGLRPRDASHASFNRFSKTSILPESVAQRHFDDDLSRPHCPRSGTTNPALTRSAIDQVSSVW